ncbi:uncharacterized protein BDR25DRAFT_363825 [Lindgomyces ingoldianus]|uniref:Uncharacterized protein n=1 Tax=Lindgomyces ingoldianus TaxID=673940 RepID=A0ACB6Q8V9_9PLEO|nr:uncharacterized protein BDR25DRAFT_363825 [Lindgomyces ingoldianus]KAF2462606.1 hypothetical protein BDR25DRAFT_363825 [Lindgomyces ingoldianus]
MHSATIQAEVNTKRRRTQNCQRRRRGVTGSRIHRDLACVVDVYERGGLFAQKSQSTKFRYPGAGTSVSLGAEKGSYGKRVDKVLRSKQGELYEELWADYILYEKGASPNDNQSGPARPYSQTSHYGSVTDPYSSLGPWNALKFWIRGASGARYSFCIKGPGISKRDLISSKVQESGGCGDEYIKDGVESVTPRTRDNYQSCHLSSRSLSCFTFIFTFTFPLPLQPLPFALAMYFVLTNPIQISPSAAPRVCPIKQHFRLTRVKGNEFIDHGERRHEAGVKIVGSDWWNEQDGTETHRPINSTTIKFAAPAPPDRAEPVNVASSGIPRKVNENLLPGACIRSRLITATMSSEHTPDLSTFPFSPDQFSCVRLISVYGASPSSLHFFSCGLSFPPIGQFIPTMLPFSYTICPPCVFIFAPNLTGHHPAIIGEIYMAPPIFRVDAPAGGRRVLRCDVYPLSSHRDADSCHTSHASITLCPEDFTTSSRRPLSILLSSLGSSYPGLSDAHYPSLVAPKSNLPTDRIASPGNDDDDMDANEANPNCSVPNPAIVDQKLRDLTIVDLSFGFITDAQWPESSRWNFYITWNSMIDISQRRSYCDKFYRGE